ncbi:MAG TPA: O-antigen ligase family protein [Stellaceae bacterium]
MMQRASRRYLIARNPAPPTPQRGEPPHLPSARATGAARPVPARRKAAKPWLKFDSDGVFAFIIFAVMLLGSMLFVSNSMIGAVLFAALALAYTVTRFSQLGEILASRWLILVIPIFAFLSTLWSQAPTETIKYSLEFGLTVVVGLLLSAAPRPKAVLWGMFPAFALYVIASVGFGQNVDMGTAGQVAFSGLTESKNLLADIASTGLLISLACFVAGIEDRWPVRALLALMVAALHGYVLVEARSAGSLMGTVVAVGCFVFLLALRPARLSVRVMTTVSAVIGAVFVVLAYGSVLVEDAMTMFDKDPTLTGRTYLWQRAGDFIADNPLLGKGFSAFWLQGNPDAEGLWAYGGIQARTGFSFHNTAIEILVHLGWVGLFVFGVTAVISAWLLLRRVMTRPTLPLCFWFSVIAYDAARLSIESLGTAPFAHPTVLLFTAFGVAYAARRAVPVAALSRRPGRPAPARALRPAFSRSAFRPSRFPL